MASQVKQALQWTAGLGLALPPSHRRGQPDVADCAPCMGSVYLPGVSRDHASMVPFLRAGTLAGMRGA